MDLSQTRTARDNPSSVVYERKFDVALRDTFYKTFLASQDKTNAMLVSSRAEGDNNYYRKRLLNRMDNYIEELIQKKYPDMKIVEDSDHVARVMIRILDLTRPLDKNRAALTQMARLKALINQNVSIQLGFNTKNNRIGTGNRVRIKFRGNIENRDLPLEITNLLSLSKHFSRIIDKSNRMFSSNYLLAAPDTYLNKVSNLCTYEISDLDLTILWSESLLYIRLGDILYRAPRAVILLIHNKLCDLISVLTLATFSESSVMPINACESTIDFIRCLAKLIIQHKNNGFGILKVLEGLCIAETLLEEEDWYNSSFLDNIVKDLEEKCSFSYRGSDLQSLIKSADAPFRHELSCLSKIVGHPYVNMEQGAKRLHEKVTEELFVDPRKVHDCINFFKRDYIRKHIQKYKRWPPCHFNIGHPPAAIHRAFLHNMDPESHRVEKQWGLVHRDDYQFITLDQNYTFHELENIIPQLKDKTISLLRQPILRKYFDGINPETSWKDTRLLLAYLLNPSSFHDHTSYLHQFIASDNLDQLLNYLIVRIVPKEKELKVDFRGFGCKTYEDRHRGQAQEKNTGIFLDDFSDEQTVTISELQLLKKLDAFRRIRTAYHNHKALYIVIDASAWNNRFSKHSVDDMMVPTLDRVFGAAIFSKTHMAYEKSYYYVSDGDEMFGWDGQRGGIEGLNQYTWMTVYINQMRVALQDFAFKYHILCKGDDMRIVVLVPENLYSDEEMRRLKEQVVSSISRASQDFGHKINIEESYGSCKYFSFSKAASIENIELPQTFRKIQKCYGANNAFINTLDDYIASTFSNGHSACKVNPIILPCYCVSLFWAYFYLLEHTDYAQCTDDDLCGILLVPSLLGGFPIIYLHNFYVRAESDLLSPFLELVQYCERFYPSIAQTLHKFMYVSICIPTSYRQLYSDPYSLPISRPPLPSSVLRNLLNPQLKRVTRNQDIRELIEASEDDTNNLIIQTLDSSNILRARVLASIYSSTPEALLAQFLRKFESGKSILDFLLVKKSRFRVNKQLRLVLKAEKTLQRWRLTRLNKPDEIEDRPIRQFIRGRCSTEAADMIREYAYGKPVYDVTMPCLQHQLSFTVPLGDHQNDWALRHHFTYTTTIEMTPLSRDHRMHYATGPFQPFLGFTTRTGNIAPSIHFVEKDEALLKVKNLIETSAWANLSELTDDGDLIESNVSLLAAKLLKMYTNVPMETLAPFCGRKKSGSVQHHMRSPAFRESIIPNTSCNVYNMIKGETNSHIALRTSAQKYTINLLHCYCFSVWNAFFELDVSKTAAPPHVFWGVTTDCEYCNRPIRERALIFDERLINCIILSPLAAVKFTTVSAKILHKSLETYGEKRANVLSAGTVLTFEDACIGVIQQVIDSKFIARKAIITRIGGHMPSVEGIRIFNILTGEGEPDVVGLTELKRLDIRVLIDILLQAIINEYNTTFYGESDDRVKTWIDTTPVSALPWSDIIKWVEDSGKLPRLVRDIQAMSDVPPMGCYYNPIAATRFVGQAALVMRDFNVPVRNLVYLTHYVPEDIIPHIRYWCRVARMNSVSAACDHDALVRLARARQISDEDKILVFRLLLRAVIVYGALSLIDEDYTELAEYIERFRGQGCELNLWNLDRVDQDYCSAVMEALAIGDVSDYPGLEKFIWIVSRVINSDNPTEEINEVLVNFYPIELAQSQAREEFYVKTIRVIYSSLPECIAVVRDQGQDNLDPMEELRHLIDEPIHHPPQGEGGNIIDIKVENLAPEFLHEITEMPHVADIRWFPCGRPEDVVIPPHQTYLHPGIFHSLFGTANYSANRIHYLIRACSLDLTRQTHATVLCLHDGLGGFTKYFNNTLQRSQIIFHTTPDYGIYAPEPVVTLDDEGRTNTIIYDYLKFGYTDLTSLDVVEYLAQKSTDYHIITSDLEVPKDDENYASLLYLRITQLIARCTNPNLLVILKMNLLLPRIVLAVAGVLRSLFRSVWLTSPQAETHEQYVYIISYRKVVNTMATDLIAEVEGFPLGQSVGDTLNRLNVHVRRKNRRVGVYRTLMREPLLRIHPPIDFMPIEFYRSIGFNSLGVLLSLLLATPSNSSEGLDISLKLALKIGELNGNESLEVKWAKVGVSTHPLITRMTRMLADNQLPNPRRTYWNLDNRTHRLSILRKIFTLYGIRYVLLSCTKSITHGLHVQYPQYLNQFRVYCGKWTNGRDLIIDPNFNPLLIMEDKSQWTDQEVLWSDYNYGIIVTLRAIVALCHSNRTIVRRLRQGLEHDEYDDPMVGH